MAAAAPQDQPPPGSGSDIPIRIQVNGEARACRAGLSLEQVLQELGYRPRLVVVEFNGEILPRRQWPGQPVVESDVLEVVTIVGGGS
jgi:sulfur carrier protein